MPFALDSLLQLIVTYKGVGGGELERHNLSGCFIARAPPPSLSSRPPRRSCPSICKTLTFRYVVVSRGCARSRGEGEVRGFVLIGRSKQIFMSGRLDDAFESARAPSGLRQVDSALGGSVGRDVLSDGGGAAHLLSEGVFFGQEQKSHRCKRLVDASVGSFSPWETASSQFWQSIFMRR